MNRQINIYFIQTFGCGSPVHIMLDALMEENRKGKCLLNGYLWFPKLYYSKRFLRYITILCDLLNWPIFHRLYFNNHNSLLIIMDSNLFFSIW